MALHRIDLGALPERLADLATYLGPLPIDPFSGGGLRYQPGEVPQQVTAYSVGPDMEDNSGQLRYDASNGTFSAGDVFFGRE